MAKSDRTDADLLSELWAQSMDGERWWEVWLPPPLVRDRREWLRYRMSLVRMQTRLKNQIHAILHRHGIVQEFADLFGTEGRRMLQRLATGNDERLQGGGQAMLAGYLRLLTDLRRQIARVTLEVYRQVTRTPEAKRLKTLPGIGMILAHTILGEVGDMRRFRSAKHLASYSLLAPRAYDSGKEKETDDAPKGRHVGHVGRRTLKWAWIEAAHGAVRSGGRLREIFNRYTDGGKRNRNRGYIVVGHELCRIAYSMSNKERDYQDAPPARPGSAVKRTKAQREAHRERRKADRILRRRARAGSPRKTGVDGDACLSAGYGQERAEMTCGNSRPGTGGLDCPMVAVG
jgi:transposase